MSDLSLYKSCLQKVAIYLKDGIYKSCHENPFSDMPSSIVNDVLSATIDLQRRAALRSDHLELLLTSGRILLTSGRLRELKIHEKDVDEDDACQLINQVLCILKSHCQELEILHLTSLIDCDEWEFDMSEAIENVLKNSPNLKDLVSSFSFDLKALRNCKKLRSVKLGFQRQQPWYDFLAKENDHLQSHKCLEFFTLSSFGLDAISCADIVIILRHCPELTSLGDIELSEVLSLLHKMRFPPSELKLRYCYLRDKSHYENLNLVNHWGIKDSVKYYPLMKELHLDTFSMAAISYLRNLKNLVYLNITSECRENIGEVFSYALQEIGPRLKHLSYGLNSPVDSSILLQHCHNLESLRISVGDQPISASSVVHLPRLQRFCFSGSEDNLERILPQFSGCNQLTDLFILTVPKSLDDETWYRFLKRNSLLNLKLAYLKFVSLTELGFKEFLLKAPQLENVEIVADDFRSCHFNRVRRETNHKAICNENSLSPDDEFFEKRSFY